VSFANNTLTKKSTVVVEGDYNTTKLVFEFEEDVSNKQVKFGMTNPRGELVMYCGLIDNEVILSSEDIDGKISSVFATDGLYTFRVFLLGENGESQLSSAPGYLPIDQSQVQTGMKAYGPFIDSLMKQVANLDINASSKDGVTTIKVTRQDGSIEVCEIYDGKDGEPAKTTQTLTEEGTPDAVSGDAILGFLSHTDNQGSLLYVVSPEYTQKTFNTWLYAQPIHKIDIYTNADCLYLDVTTTLSVRYNSKAFNNGEDYTLFKTCLPAEEFDLERGYLVWGNGLLKDVGLLIDGDILWLSDGEIGGDLDMSVGNTSSELKGTRCYAYRLQTRMSVVLEGATQEEMEACVEEYRYIFNTYPMMYKIALPTKQVEREIDYVGDEYCE
jgi:hypothetical protein